MIGSYVSNTLKEQKMAEAVFTDGNFDDEVLKADTPVLVDFWAVWCGPCRLQDPIVEEIAKELEQKVKIGKLNVDENPAVTQKYSIMSIPTLMIFKGGTVVKQFIGVQSKAMLVSELNKLTN